MKLFRRLLCWLAPVFLFTALCLPAAHAQVRSSSAAAAEGGETTSGASEKTPAFQYMVAIVFVMAVLVVVCMPSRKGYSERR
jgi:hypothetical protein